MGIQKISIEDFNNIQQNHGGRIKSELGLDLEAMTHGEAIVIDHTGYQHSPYCTLRTILARHKTANKKFSMRHLQGDKIAIACIPIPLN